MVEINLNKGGYRYNVYLDKKESYRLALMIEQVITQHTLYGDIDEGAYENEQEVTLRKLHALLTLEAFA